MISFEFTVVAWTVKNLSAMQETQVRSLGREDPLEEGMETAPSVSPEGSWGRGDVGVGQRPPPCRACCSAPGKMPTEALTHGQEDGTLRATEVMVPWSPPPYAPAPPPSLLEPERTDPSPVSPLPSGHAGAPPPPARSLALTYRPRHTHGPGRPSLPPPVLLPAPCWPVPFLP